MTAGVATTVEKMLEPTKEIVITWTSGDVANGNATVTTTNVFTGQILRVVTVPGTGGDTPDDNYDITLTTDAGVDVGAGLLLNRSSTLTQWVTSGMGAVVGSKLTFLVDNAGSTNKGTCYVYIGGSPEMTTGTANVEQALYGAAGITSFPAAAAAADGVSIAEVVRYIQASQIGSLANTGGTATLAGILGDVANVTVASSLANILAEVTEVEGHFHTRARWFGKKAVQTATDWADDTLTPFQAISGNGAYGSDANDEAQVFGTADTVIAGQTKFDMSRILVVASSVTSIYKLRLVYGTGTMADAIAAGQYTETMAVVASASSRIAAEDIRMPRLTIGTDKVWLQCWNATNNATIDFFVGIHGYVS